MEVLIFQIDKHLYGFDAATVMEIVEPLPVTWLPFAPAEVEGLINVSGRVIPQVCASLRLVPGDVACPDAGVVIILAVSYGYCACRVSRVIARRSIMADAVAKLAAAETRDFDTITTGEFLWNDTMVLLLDPEQLIRARSPEEVDAEAEKGLVSERHGGEFRRDTTCDDLFPAVVFTCNSELFALRFADVAEVVESGIITPLPGAPTEMAGVIVLRGEPLPVFSLRLVLFGDNTENTPFTLIVHINDCRVGLLVESVVGIRRYPRESLRPLAEEQALLEGIITTVESRVLALLRLSALAVSERFAAWQPWLAAGKEDSAGHAHEAKPATVTKRMLLFRQGKELLALPLDMVERIEEYWKPTATPGDQSSTVNGVIQVHGNVMPVRSLERFFRLASGADPSVYLIVVSGGNRCALPIEKIERIFDMGAADIEPVDSGVNSLLSGIGTCNGMLVSIIAAERLVV